MVYANITLNGLTMPTSDIVDRLGTKNTNVITYYIVPEGDISPRGSSLVPKEFSDWQLAYINSVSAKVSTTFNVTLNQVMDYALADIPIIGPVELKASISSWTDTKFFDSAKLIMSINMGKGYYDDSGTWVEDWNDYGKNEWKKVYLHEVGHLLGLEHPWDQKDGDTDKDVDSSSDPHAPSIMGAVGPNIFWDQWFEPIDLYTIGSIWGVRGSAKQIADYANAPLMVVTERMIQEGTSLNGEGVDFSSDHLIGIDVLGTIDGDFFLATDANETIDGGTGLDSIVYGSTLSQHTLVNASGVNWTLSDVSTANIDTLKSLERVHFSDKSVALDISAGDVGGSCYRIYKAAFNRTPDEGGLGYWIGQMDRGMDLIEVSARFIDSDEFRSSYGTNPTNGEFLTKVYNNVLSRDPDTGGYEWWVDQLANNEEKTWQKVLADFSEGAENQANVLSLIGNGIVYDLAIV
jgi:hypothetical protein